MMDIAQIIQNRIYKELAVELTICKNNSIFLVLCPDKSFFKDIIDSLKKDLKEHDFHSLNLNEQQIDFSTFFEHYIIQNSKKIQLCHIDGIENLSNRQQIDFIGFLQSINFISKSAPYILLLWMTAKFEKNFFSLAPDICRQLIGTYDFSSLSPHKQSMQKSDETLLNYHEKIAHYLTKVIWQYEHWKNVVQNKDSFFIEIMANADLHDYYVPLYFSNKNGRIFLLDDLLKVFLENKNINFLTLLGASGTGKSSFALYYFIYLAKQYIKNPKTNRIPIFISLKNYTGSFNSELFLIDIFEKNFGIKLSLIKIQDILLKGKFIFFIDSFDEMASSSNIHNVQDDLEELAKLSVKNIILENGIAKPQPANKVFLTCKTHYFLIHVQQQDIIKAGYTNIYKKYAGKQNYQIARLNLNKFDEAGIKDYIVKNTPDGITARNVLGIINNPYNLNKLSTHEILQEMIIRTVPFYKKKKEINAADLYNAYTDIWIKQNDWRFHMKPAGKRKFLHGLALKMFQKGDGHFLHFSQADMPDKTCFKEGFKNADAQTCRDETNTCEFLSCDDKGQYRFVHRSFMDYFIAENYFFNIIQNKKRPVEYSHLEEEMKEFLKLIISSEKADLQDMDLNSIDLSKSNLYYSNLSKANLSKANLSNAILMNSVLHKADLTAADLSNAKLIRANCSEADFSGANINEAKLREADLTNARFNGAALKGADLRGAKLRGAKLAWTDLSEANLSGADLTGANLTDTDLSGVNLDNAVLSEADLTGSNLTRAILTGVNLTSAKLNNVDLSSVNLSKTNFKWAKLNSANLSLANLSKASLRAADLTRANIDDANCKEADFRWAKLNYAKLRETDLQEADLTGADLTKAKLSGANLTWGNLSHARFEDTDLEGAKLNMTKAGDADFTGANLSDADLTWADLTKSKFCNADMSDINLSEADLTGAVLTDAKLNRANFKGSNLKGADLRGSEQTNAKFDGADITDAKMK